MKIKEKTKLRKEIKSSIGNTGSLDMVEFYDDGTWEIMSQSTYSNYSIHRQSLGSLASNLGYNETTDQAITENFFRIEHP
jgi:hypothetical protein